MFNLFYFYITLLFIFHYAIALQRKYPSNGNIRYDRNSGVAVSIGNANYVTWGGSVEERANNFLKNNRKILTISETKDEEEFKIISTKKVAVWTIVRFMQMFKGVPVYGSSIAITINEDNRVRMITSSYTKGVFFEGDPTKPIQTKRSILNKITNKFGKERIDNIEIYSSEKVIYQVGEGYCRLAWSVELSIHSNDYLEIVYDDETGEILHEVDETLDKNGNRYKAQMNQHIMDEIRIETSKQSMEEEKKENDKLIAKKSIYLRREITEDERVLKTNKNNGVGFFKTLASLFNTNRCESGVLPLSSQPTQISSTSRTPSVSPSFMPTSSSPSIFPSLSLSPSTSAVPSRFPSEAPTRPPFNEKITAGYVFDPDPLSTANKTYCDPGFCDNEDDNTAELSEQLILVELLNITTINGTYFLKGPYAQIVDVDGKHGLYEQKSNDFRFNRSNPAFEAVNCYYHVDKFMSYVNEDLGIDVMPTNYEGGVKCDPHAFAMDNSYYNTKTGILSFGDGKVDDAEDASVIIHELGHGIHSWITNNSLSRVEGLSEGFGDYLAASYLRSLNLRDKNDPAYYNLFHWDAHGNASRTRNVINPNKYPLGISGDIYKSGSIWSSVNMQIWDEIGRYKSDKIHLMGISSTNKNSNQVDAANALYGASVDLGLDNEETQIIREIYEKRGYKISSYCGDGIVSDGEDCDGNVGNKTCDIINCSGGNLKCGSDCKWNFTSCASDDELVWDMTLTFDGFPRETIWAIFDTDNKVVQSKGDGSEYDDLEFVSIRESFCLDRSHCYTFNLHDTKGDGIGDENENEDENENFSIFVDGVPFNMTSFPNGFDLYYEFGTNCTP